MKLTEILDTDLDMTNQPEVIEDDGGGENRPIPTYIEFLYPVMLILSDGSSRTMRQITSVVADKYFGLDVKNSDSAIIPRLNSRVSSALGSLHWNGMVDTQASGKFYSVTPVGRMILNRYPSGLKGRGIFNNSEFYSVQSLVHAISLLTAFKYESKTGIPYYPIFMVPILSILSDGVARPFQKIVEIASTKMSVTDGQLSEPSSVFGTSLFAVRVEWALFALFRLGVIECLTSESDLSYEPLKAVFQIGDLGRKLLIENHDGFEVDSTALALSSVLQGVLAEIESREMPEDDEFSPDDQRVSSGTHSSHSDPIRQIESSIDIINSQVSAELLKIIHEGHPYAFESIVVELLMAMGYGDKGDGRRIGGSGDGGVDGVINQDKLGLDQIYIQAKRYAPNNPVGRPDIQGFVGALAGKGASRGVFITTSRFSPGAEEYARSIPARIILIDGKRLTDLMIQYRVGVQIEDTHVVVGVDKDFFD